MPDDSNDKLMEQFIEKATPSLIEALSKQIESKIESQIGGLVEHSTKLLDEVKDAKREREQRDKADRDEYTQLKTLLERHADPAAINDASTPQPIQLTRTQARDTTIYRRARDQAEKSGTTVEIVTDG
ncbi:MAG: hypothetical protein ABJL99_21030 [Aliishimia sp.]